MIFLLDAGNTRIKWALADGGQWLDRGALSLAEVGELGHVAAQWPGVKRALLANVAGSAIGAAITDALRPWQGRCRWFQSSPACAGLRNGYEDYRTLGCDRWAAMIGAWSRLGTACLVVNAGTAMTGDLIFPEGAGALFRGGVILPGYDLMRQSLYRNAAQLPLAEGHWQALPRNTHDAIVSGCLQAMAGAVERLHRQLPPGSPCVLSGGTADLLAPLLDLPLLRLDNLVLEGLARVAALDDA